MFKTVEIFNISERSEVTKCLEHFVNGWVSNKGEHKFILTNQEVGNLPLKISKKYNFKIYKISKDTNEVSVKIKNLPVIF